MATARKPAAKPAAQARATATKAAPQAAAPKAPPRALKAPAPAKAAPKPVAPQSAKAAAPKAEKKAKPEKVKVVRDSFTIPKDEYAVIAALKKRALTLGSEAKKSELIRAGLMLLAAGSDALFTKALAQVPTLKTGRPGKG